jgi:hypothetical protein
MDAWLDRLRNEITEATMGLNDSEWNRAPKGRWNSAQILEHLGRTYGTTAKMLELMIGAGSPPQVRPARLTEFLLRVLIVDMGVFPSGAKSPAMVAPIGEPGPSALKRALTNLERMDAAIAAAEERWGEGPIAMHPILGPFNASQWRRFHCIHGHHHVRQIKKRAGDRAAKSVI